MVSSEGSCGGVVEWPPGFRFHPTDEELVLYYLKRKICRKKLKLNIIAETDVYKWDPEELPGMSLLKTGDRLWFFFSPRDRKYPNGARSNRATKQGYWKATGKDRNISCGPRLVGLKKTLVFYRGRAPNGERTDWVMHEYTLDEDEFKRCQNVQGYYALYKVYKKSGPGPKNGEQYGAPFREEDWNDDCPDFNNISAEKVDEGLPNARLNVDSQVPFTPDDIEVFMKNLTEDPLFDLPSTSDSAYTPTQGEMKNTTMDLLCRDIGIQEPINMLYSSGVQRNLQASFDDFSHVTQTQSCDYEVESSAKKMGEEEVYVLPEEDFLEMDDLLGPEPIKENVNGLLIDERDGFSEFDLYHDAAMFLNDLGPGPGPGPTQLGPGEVVHQLYVQLPAGDLNQSYLQVADSVPDQIYPNNAYQFNPYDESQGSVLTSAEFYHGVDDYSDPSSGLVNESGEGNQNQGLDENGGPTSWLSSAVWSFVESIPTTPASAAENALVNRAFERMSSFSRLRIGAMNASISANSDSEIVKSSSVKRGLIFFPVLVAVIAIFWVVLGAVSVRGIGLSA